jgi:hypothetical protein
LNGELKPDRLIKMTPEELASRELAKWREFETKHVSYIISISLCIFTKLEPRAVLIIIAKYILFFCLHHAFMISPLVKFWNLAKVYKTNNSQKCYLQWKTETIKEFVQSELSKNISIKDSIDIFNKFHNHY